MVKIQINKVTYSIRSTWHDLAIADARRLMEIKPPARLVQFWKGELKVHEVQNSDTKAFGKFFGDVLCFLGDIPAEVMDKVLPDERIYLFTHYAKDIVSGVWCSQPFGYTPAIVDSFIWNGQQYMMPHTKEVLGSKVTFADTRMAQFCEIADLQAVVADIQNDMFASAAMFVSVCTRKPGEQYDEDEAIRRAAEFEQMPVAIFWDVFFSLQRLGMNLLSEILCFLNRKRETKKQRRTIFNRLASVFTCMNWLKRKSQGHGTR